MKWIVLCVVMMSCRPWNELTGNKEPEDHFEVQIIHYNYHDYIVVDGKGIVHDEECTNPIHKK